MFKPKNAHTGILFLILAVNSACLIPELKPTPDLNDSVLHITLINGMVNAIEHHANPLDFYSPEIGLGQEIVKYYQPAGHLIVAAIYFALFKLVPVATVFLWIKFLSLALIPLSFYAATRLLELPDDAQLAAAMLAPLVAGDSFGIDYGSYVWAGHGLFPQAIAAHFLLLTIGAGWQAIQRGRPVALSAGALILTGWSNLLYGYIGALMLCLMAIHPGRDAKARARTLATIAAAGAVAALPKVAAWAGKLASPGEIGSRAPMSDSYGASKVLADLFAGQTFDAGRIPVLTALVVLGIVVTVWKKRNPFLLWGFAAMVALYFGRPFWGDALYLIGITRSMPLHRVIGPVQIFGVMLASIGLGDQVRCRIPGAYGPLAVALIIAPAVQERLTYLRQGAQWATETRQAFSQDGPDIEQALAIAKAQGGRVYAGMPYLWGMDFKIGAVPVYALLPPRGIASVGFLYIGLTERAASMYTFREKPEQFKEMGIRAIIAPDGRPRIGNSYLLATFGRFAVYSVQSN